MKCEPKAAGSGEKQVVRLSLTQDSLTAEIELPEQLEIYRGVYSYHELPNQITAIFDSLQEFHQFLQEAELLVEAKALLVPAVVVGKTKMLKLPLEEVELTGEWKLRKTILSLEGALARRNEEYGMLLSEKEEVGARLEQQIELTRERESEGLKLANRIRHLENTIEELLNDKAKSENNLQESKLTEEYTPVKKIHHEGKPKKTRELQDFGKRLIFKIDESSRHFSKFDIKGNDVEKLHGPTYQLYHSEPLPKAGRLHFDIKVVSIKNNNIVVGVISEKNKDEQFSFKKPNSVCYNGYDGSICEQDRPSYVTIKPKENNRLRTVVDMTLAQVEWYIMGSEIQKTFIGKAQIPPAMTKQLLFPYFELYWEGNKVKLNATS